MTRRYTTFVHFLPLLIGSICILGLIQCGVPNNSNNATSEYYTSNYRFPFQDTFSWPKWSSIFPSGRFSLGSLLNLDMRPTPKAAVPLKCGEQFKSYSERIVGGQVATITRFPWMISLQREKGNWYGLRAYYHSCGGSLITNSWIVTAAHCLYNRDEPLRAVAGTDNLNYLYRAQIREVTRQIIHPKFDITTYDNDIALIKVGRPFELDSTFSHVGTLCLSPSIPILPYDIATICGFGSRAFHAKTRSHLYETQIAIIDRRTCNRSFEGAITQNMICAGGMIANKRDACSGDSGGPLTLENGDGRMLLAGIVSFGQDCARAHYPGIYTNAQVFYEWLSRQIDEPLEKVEVS